MKKFIMGLLAFITSGFTGFFKIFKNEALPIINLIEGIKQAINNPAFDLFVWATHNKIDDAILLALRKAIALIIPGTVTDDQIKVFIESLRGLNPNITDATLQKLSSIIYKIIKGEQVKQSEADTVMQLSYSKFKNFGYTVNFDIPEGPKKRNRRSKEIEETPAATSVAEGEKETPAATSVAEGEKETPAATV
ncbi:MAG: hypothetical protein K9I36_16770 [Bacteroidia bacterium]|nr:hypothetical protein [Bacteroidia bacterium]